MILLRWRKSLHGLHALTHFMYFKVVRKHCNQTGLEREVIGKQMEAWKKKKRKMIFPRWLVLKIEPEKYPGFLMLFPYFHWLKHFNRLLFICFSFFLSPSLYLFIYFSWIFWVNSTVASFIVSFYCKSQRADFETLLKSAVTVGAVLVP